MDQGAQVANAGSKNASGECPSQATEGMSRRDVKVSASYMEIYNESVNDLLDGSKRNLEIRDSKDGVVVERLTSREASCAQGLIDILNEGEQLRSMAETKQNSVSSRSHTVFRISIEINDHNTQTGRRTTKSSQIQIVDLAGSEGASKTQNKGLRLREGNNINKSLLALSNVIYKLSQRQQMTKNNYYINYRDSKLTRILQHSLCGKSQTAIICCISSLASNLHESLQALQFGTKAKNIKTQVHSNEVIREQPAVIAAKMVALQTEVNELTQQIADQQARIAKYQTMEVEYEAIGPLRIQLDSMESQVAEKQQQIIRLQNVNDDMACELKEVSEALSQQRHLAEIYTESKESLVKNAEALQEQLGH